jgi:hypothetical protein
MSNNKQTSTKKPAEQKNKKHAFSFVELAIAIVVIGVLVAGVMLGLDMIDKSKLATAKNLTKNSPVEGVESLFAWYETTSDSSILPSENNKGSSLSIWKDIKVGNIAIDAVQSNGTYKPEFSGKINGLTTTSFDGTGKNFAVDATNLNNTDYTIIVAEKRNSGSDDNYFIGDSSITSDNENILLGYSSSGQVIHSQGGTNSYDSSVSAYSDSSGATRIFTFIQKKSSGKETYINGYLAGQDSDTSNVTNLSNLIIGKDYNGEIGEIIIYNKALSGKDRRNVEAYLGKKWAVEVAGLDSSSCTNGIITDAGCEIPSCSQNVVGIAETINANNGDSDTVACNVAHYAGSIDYVCNDTTLEVTGSCHCATGYAGDCSICDEDAGYSMQGGSCVLTTCDVSGVTGVTDTVVSATGSLNCDVAGYSGSVNFSCTTGPNANITGSCSCDTAGGYTEVQSLCTALCTGGTVDSSSVSGRVVHKFNSSGTLNCPKSKTNGKILVVAGGGGAGDLMWGVRGGGGGAGGLIYQTGYTISSGSTTITVGAGGAAQTNGGNSQIGSSLTAIGGGRGGKGGSGGSGGSGGGGSGNSPARAGGVGVSGQGTNGATGTNFSSGCYGSGGGGGAGAAGGEPTSSTGGNGGNGSSYDITGTSVTYAGGGAGGSYCTQGEGGAGGGGGASTGANGASNTGGGGANFNGTVGSGGSGVVIISYPI